MTIIDTAKQRLEEARERVPGLDHLLRTVGHYGSVKGNALAGAVTYFAFISFFPILALAFAVIGYVAKVYDRAQDQLIVAIDSVLPDMVSADGANGTIAISDVQEAAGAALGIGIVGVLYAGLGWLSGMRDALNIAFEKPRAEQPSFFVGKAKDLASMVLIGVTLVVSVAVSGVVSGLSEQILELVGLGEELSPLLKLLTVLIGLAANMLLFYALFRLLANPSTPKRSLWSGALLGAVGFEVLKRLSSFLIASTKEQPAFQAFGIALVLVVWMNYFSRVVMYAASWAHTSPEAIAQREADRLAAAAVQGPQLDLAEAARANGVRTRRPAASFAAGAASALGVLAVVRRRK